MVRQMFSLSRSIISRLIHIPLHRYNYKDILPELTNPLYKDENTIPVLLPNWDNSPRRNEGALILHNATPKLFYQHCVDVFSLIKEKQDKTVFIKSWNEWGEGNYMEPCLKYGHGYIESLAKALKAFDSL